VTAPGGDTADTRDGGTGDRIHLRNLRVVGTHGVLAEEKSRAQPFEVDLDLTVDLALAGVTDRLAAAVAEGVLASDLRITAVTVHLRKLRPPLPLDLATVGVRITRRQ
jgi:dihydroneopterin aldolase